MLNNAKVQGLLVLALGGQPHAGLPVRFTLMASNNRASMKDHPGRKQDDPHPERVTWLAFERTFLAHERTQMAWVRTSLALISFGFAIGKFFRYLHEQRPERLPLMGASGIGTLMIVIGLVALALASLQHVRAMKVLRARCPGLPASLAWVIDSLLALLGILALVVVWLRE